MRRLTTALVLALTASPAIAQTTDETSPAAPPEPAATSAPEPSAPSPSGPEPSPEAVAPAPEAPRAPAQRKRKQKTAASAGLDAGTSSGDDQKRVEVAARAFFVSLISGDARSIARNSALPFQLEGQRYVDPKALFDAWLRELRGKRTDLLELRGLELLRPQEMEKKYGKPPARLQALPWRGERTWIAVANLSGHTAIALFEARPQGEVALSAFTD